MKLWDDYLPKAKYIFKHLGTLIKNLDTLMKNWGIQNKHLDNKQKKKDPWKSFILQEYITIYWADGVVMSIIASHPAYLGSIQECIWDEKSVIEFFFGKGIKPLVKQLLFC